MTTGHGIPRRQFLKQGMAAAGAALASHLPGGRTVGKETPQGATAPGSDLASFTGRIGRLNVTRLLLGGNLLTHVTHSRDLRYVGRLAAHYNTEAKIRETLAAAEEHGINTLVMTAVPAFEIAKKHRKAGGKIQWIIAPTVRVEPGLGAYRQQVREIADAGAEAVYLLGHWADGLAGAGKMDLLAEAVAEPKHHDLLSGVGCHDLNVVTACEERGIGTDFYIKTFHHHRYPSAPRPEQLRGAFAETPGYWCRDPQATLERMRRVEKPWIAFKVMAAGAIPPGDAFKYAFDGGADHVLAGMFDFEIAEDVAIARDAVAKAVRGRPWRS